MRIVQVTPASDPALGGVTSYAEALAEALARRSGLASDLVPVGDALPEAFPAATVCLVHYVNYAYHPRGCPRGLVSDLRRWRQAAPERRLVTFFHEVYATGPIWRSSFWLSPLQQHLAATLARTSDRIATSLHLYGRMLTGFSPRGEVMVTPVFSTVGEPETVPALAQRPPTMLVFGGRGARARAYGEERAALAEACRALEIREIVDIGPPLEPPGRIDGIPVDVLGPLPAGQVSARLLGARAGFLAYPWGFLPKSTIFAAYCAHGLLPVHAGSPRHPHGDLSDRRDLPGVRAGAAGLSPEERQALASAARSWYLEHSIARQAESFRDLLLMVEPRP